MDAVSKKLALAARYRPQTFAEVAGQEMVKAVLSRSCAEDRPACAYLFSGTRGVGKTTVARIFAKALNCEKGPAHEPCNACAQCTKIMQGNHVDVVEIDGASNNKVDNIRALKEIVGYAPMEGRYKIFIIDEAHMLTSQAFNALLKTLEEPPPRVIFIMATTEAHKFPVTIVSRCQHFTFRHLNEEEISAHLLSVLEKESLPCDQDAVRLIAKRAQGSVRDSMSLLDQTLALGNDRLSLEVTREVLGLAGQEFFEQLFAAMHAGDCVSIVSLTRGLLRRGVDIGFFLRELAEYLRSLFLFAQAGSQILAVLQLSPAEQAFLLSLAGKFSPAHLHAAWQLVLDGQRGVVLSTEPASALELLLLNLALLPRLLPLEKVPLDQFRSVQADVTPSAAPAQGTQRAPAQTLPVTHPAVSQPTEIAPEPVSRPETALKPEPLRRKPEEDICSEQAAGKKETPQPLTTEHTLLETTQQKRAEMVAPHPAPEAATPDAETLTQSQAEAQSQPSELVQPSENKTDELSEQTAELPAPAAQKSPLLHGQEPAQTKASLLEDNQAIQGSEQPVVALASAEDESNDLQDGDELSEEAEFTADSQITALDWQSFCRFYQEQLQEDDTIHFAEQDLRGLDVLRLGSHVRISSCYEVQYDRLLHSKERLIQGLQAFLNVPSITLEIIAPTPARSSQDLVEQLRTRDELRACFTVFDAVIERCHSL
ncbi:MAG: DNA polymerase III subunit gamma/tau [Desulfovibrio sp.]|nr:DNA polymerase III subunit gamma/tau [Desulfovibrio sp.]